MLEHGWNWSLQEGSSQGVELATLAIRSWIASGHTAWDFQKETEHRGPSNKLRPLSISSRSRQGAPKVKGALSLPLENDKHNGVPCRSRKKASWEPLDWHHETTMTAYYFAFYVLPSLTDFDVHHCLNYWRNPCNEMNLNILSLWSLGICYGAYLLFTFFFLHDSLFSMPLGIVELLEKIYKIAQMTKYQYNKLWLCNKEPS